MQSVLDLKWALFLKVADVGSLSGAALSLDIPLSVVSRHISALETEAGARLFRRTGRGVVLTEFGLEIYPRVTELVRSAEHLIDYMHASSGIPMGDVRIGLPPSTVPLLAGRLITAVRQDWPKVRLHLTEGPSAQLEEWLTQGRLDLALLLREDGIEVQDDMVLVRLPLYLVVPAGHALAGRESITFEEVASLPLVLPSEPHPLRERLAKIAKADKLNLTHVVEANSIRLQHEVVACDGGFAITSGTFTPDEARKLAAVRIVEPEMTRAVVLQVTSHRSHTHATWQVGRLLKAIAPSALGTLNQARQLGVGADSEGRATRPSEPREG